MRTLKKNKRLMYYANITGEQRVTIEGLVTPDIETLYETPILLKANYSSCTGEVATEVFGTSDNFSRTIVFAENCPLKENAKVWIGIPITNEANYKVVKIADSKNGYVVALSEYV